MRLVMMIFLNFLKLKAGKQLKYLAHVKKIQLSSLEGKIFHK